MIPDHRITYNGARVRIVGPEFVARDNIRIIEAGWDSIKERLAKGINSDDSPSKPLSPSYARLKSRRFGLPPVRDLRLTGALLDREIQVRYADERGAIMDASTREGRMKARLNRDELLFSERDQAAMSDVAEKTFKGQVQRLFSTSGRYGGGRAEFARGNEFTR